MQRRLLIASETQLRVPSARLCVGYNLSNSTPAGSEYVLMSLSRSRIFLLSPANVAGIRAQYVLGPNAESELACRLRGDGVSLGELFSFVSSLYFRGKLAYAQAFAAPPPNLAGSFVITAAGGLLSPETLVTLDRLREVTGTDIDPSNQSYLAPLLRDCRQLCRVAGDSCDVVLLGSVATAKYVDPLLEVFGNHLLFPVEFAGRGDMSRGGLLLRCVTAGKELAYVPVLNGTRHGPRPTKLMPLPRRRGKPLSS